METTCVIDLNNDEITQISGILKSSKKELPSKLMPYAKSALEEYLRMILGQKIFTRGSDFQEYRLFLLIKYVFNNEIPNEQSICDLFQTTVSQSRSLLRSVMSKYQYELDSAIHKSMKKIVELAEPSDENSFYTVMVDNENLIATLNRLQLSIQGDLETIRKVPNTVSKYKLSPSSYDALTKHFGIIIEEVKK